MLPGGARKVISGEAAYSVDFVTLIAEVTIFTLDAF